MKRRLHLFIIITMLCFSLFSFNEIKAAGHELKEVYIHVQVLENGDALINEKRVAYLTEGTENYFPVENLGASEILDFSLVEDDVVYEFVDPWDSDASQEDKTYKNGLIETARGYELVWGIGNYGEHTYELEYTITNMIKQVEDAQMLFWQFIGDQMRTPPQYVEIEIETDFDLSFESEKVWGFGFEGEVEFEEGKVIARSLESFEESNYATILLEFEEDAYSQEHIIDILPKTIEDVKDEAFKGSNYAKKKSIFSVLGSIFVSFIVILLLFIPIAILVIIFRIVKGWKDNWKRRRLLRKINRTYKGRHYSDLPYEYDFIDLVYLLDEKKFTNLEYIISSYILQWIYEGLIVQEIEETRFIRRKEYTALKFNKLEVNKGPIEKRLYQIFYNASGWDHKVSPVSIIKWSNKDKRSLKQWRIDIMEESKEYLVAKGYLDEFSSKLTTNGQELQDKLYMFIKYLGDFSLIHEREPIDVKLWDQILVWATVFGLSDLVIEEFEKLHPNYIEDSAYTSIQTITYVSQFSKESSGAAHEGPSSSFTSGSSGGGGYTSSGGGGGSFGGGSGGGTR